jgi:Protein of unknown function (DUF2892)
MKKNMGSTDRVVRLIIAVAVILLYSTHIISEPWGIGLMVLAAIFLLTSFFSLCPLYLPFGINTHKRKIN